MSAKRAKVLICAAGVFAALWIVGETVVSVRRLVNDREQHQKANAWLMEAQQVATPDFTPDEAARWLKDKGFEAYKGEKAEINGQEVEEHVIMGLWVMSSKSFWTDPCDVELMFHFDTNWHFTNVELRCPP